MFMAVKHRPALVQNSCAAGTHAVQSYDALDSRATVGPGMYKIGISIVVPKGARVYPTFSLFDQERRRPRTGGVLRLDHVDSMVRVRIEDIEKRVVITN